MNQRKSNQILWTYFTLVNEDDKIASCNRCFKQFSYRTSITNLKVHLKAKHPQLYKSIASVLKSEKGGKALKRSASDTEQDVNLSSYSLENSCEENQYEKNNSQTKYNIWNYFSKETGKNKVAKCLLCFKLFSYSTSITNLKKHLKTMHSDETLESVIQDSDNVPTEQKFQFLSNSPTYILSVSENYGDDSELVNETVEPKESLTETLMDVGIIKRRPEGKKQIDTMLLKLISRMYLPISIVEDQDFRDLVQALNPNYVLPTHKVLSKKVVPFLYDRCFKEQIKMIQQEAVTVCLTADCWTSIEKNTFIGITAHFINNKFQFKSVFLKCSQINPHIKDNLPSNLRETSIEWDVFNKINMCVTDDDPEMVEATEILGWTHSSCIGHKLNLTLHIALRIFDEIFLKVNQIVSYFTICHEAKEKLIQYQVEMQGLSPPLVLLGSMDANWISIYSMIERFVHLEDSVKSMMSAFSTNLPMMSDEEWIVLKQLRKVLRPFNEAVKELSSDLYVCASKAIAVISGLKDVVDELNEKPGYDSSIKSMIESIKSQLDSRFHNLETDDSLAMCILLDPRYKLSMFRNEEAANKAKLNVISEVINLMKKENENSNTSLEESQSNKSDDCEVSLWKRRNLVLEQRKVNSPQVIPTLAQQEVESYLQDDFAHSNSEPCHWWRSGQYKFPNLAKLFKNKCNIVATSIPSERLFSKSCHTSLERSTLAPKDIEQLVFLNYNLKNRDFMRLIP